MRKLVSFLAGAALAALYLVPSVSLAYEAICGPLGVLQYEKDKSYGGYVLYTNHLGGTKTYLIDLEGNVVHEWNHNGRQAFMAELLPNGNLLRAEQGADTPVTFGGWHGSLREYDWDGNVVWEYTVRDKNRVAHHGFDRLPNGNTAILVWEKMSWDDMIAKGRDPNDPTIYKNGFKYPDGRVLE
ncbi:MAG: aryl-sulfate sulfotransferase, partial [Mailhella sp.]